jgi:ABC-type phosphate/phosphonate transport system ATPase subunit
MLILTPARPTVSPKFIIMPSACSCGVFMGPTCVRRGPQRVAIARAQVAGASVVFADEPTGALDSHTSAEVMDALIGSTTDRGHTLVVVTHDEGVAARCGRVVRLRDGRIVQTSTKVGVDGEMEFIQTPEIGDPR